MISLVLLGVIGFRIQGDIADLQKEHYKLESIDRELVFWKDVHGSAQACSRELSNFKEDFQNFIQALLNAHINFNEERAELFGEKIPDESRHFLIEYNKALETALNSLDGITRELRGFIVGNQRFAIENQLTGWQAVLDAEKDLKTWSSEIRKQAQEKTALV